MDLLLKAPIIISTEKLQIKNILINNNIQFFCFIFNITIEVEGETDPSLIDKDLVLDNYVDHYEKELIEHEEGELYKIVHISLLKLKIICFAMF